MKYLSPLEMMYKWEIEKADMVYLSQPIDGVSHNWTYTETMNEVRKMASELWQKLSDNQKKKYEVMADKDRERYMK